MKRKNGFKRITAFLTALIMLIGCMFSAVAVNAEETVFVGDKELKVISLYANRTFDLYQIFAGTMQTVNGNKMLVDIDWGESIQGTGYDYSTDLINALKASTLGDGTTNILASKCSGLTTSSDADEVAAVLKGVNNNSEEADAYAQIVSDVLSSETGNVPKRSATSSSEAGSNAGNYYAIFSNIQDGYYLIAPDATKGAATNATFSKFMLAVVGDTSINTKTNSVPTITKQIIDANGSAVSFDNAAIGDEVTFQLKGTVPGMDGYSKYFYVVQDELSKGLTFNATTGIKSVTINGVSIPNVDSEGVSESDAQWFRVEKITNTTDSTAEAFKIVFHNFIQYKSLVGKEIVVKYVATVTKDAVTGKGNDIMTGSNMNQARIEYSNNPNYSYSGTDEPDDKDNAEPKSGKIGDTEWSKTYVYTTAIEILKKDATTGTRLTGAKFKVAGTKINQVYVESDKYTPVAYYNNGKEVDANAYYQQKDDAMTKVAPTDATSANYIKDYVRYAKNTDGSYSVSLSGGYYREKDTDTYDDAVKNGVEYEMDYIIYHIDSQGSTSQLVDAKSNGANDDNQFECEAYVGTNGELVVSGLSAGTYTIEEVEAPNGYQKLENPITVTITWERPDAGKIAEGCKWTYTYTTQDGKTEGGAALTSGIMQLIVNNNSGSTLPSTGGIGTTIFYTLGSALLIGAAVLLITKRRMSREEN
jgi:fimbrial isopeptide formation D2 family protein/LPXTG-motif cell wall-anchored protein